ncbi:Uncharacterised protein [Mycobacteroides abscessus subsp. abscessus]|uniref:hypothetical protein n=1 Tax=Mycobacteroides abscessus TaxID=36809 RepID=UPI00092A26F2|nr:hypothetical protein [Mycobacteroides abscessus]SIA00004.1 Uncharacterised protein [Mycobacteroides abscessus subsp. abscessus]SIA00227.1 Uncharacterised protein [Mycobacteroides abscessus subsp. abscessus]
MTVELADSEARAVVHVLGRLIRDAAVAGRPTPHSVLDLWRRLDQTVEVSSRRQRERAVGEQLGESRIGTRAAAALLGWGTRRVQRHVADLGGELIAGRLVFDEHAVREYANALQDKEIQR